MYPSRRLGFNEVYITEHFYIPFLLFIFQSFQFLDEFVILPNPRTRIQPPFFNTSFKTWRFHPHVLKPKRSTRKSYEFMSPTNKLQQEQKLQQQSTKERPTSTQIRNYKILELWDHLSPPRSTVNRNVPDFIPNSFLVFKDSFLSLQPDCPQQRN